MPPGPPGASETRPAAADRGPRELQAGEVAGGAARRWHPTLAVTSLLGAGVSVLVWVTAALTMADKGLDVTDEGFYLLSYRWWDTSLRNFTAAQYVYGPIFELLGFDIVRLRYFRVVTVLAASGFLGWAFVRWLGARRGWSSWVWAAAAATAVVGSAGMMFSWLPLSPGYNDLTGLMALVGLGLVLHVATLAERGTTVPWWVFVALGILSVVMVMGRWSAVVAAAVLIAGAVAVSPRPRWPARLAALGLTLVGVLLALLAVHLLIVPLDAAVEGLLGPNRLTSEDGHSPQTLFTRYRESTFDLVSASGTSYWPLLSTAVVAGLVSKGRWAVVTGALGVCVLGLTVVQAITDEPVVDASEYRDRFGAGLIALALTVLATGVGAACSSWWERRGWPPSPGRRTIVAGGLLLVMPWVAGVGTNNHLWLLALNLFAATLAFMVTVLVHIDSARSGARVLGFATIAVAVAVSSVTARDALLNHPYRSVTAEAATTVVGDGTTPWGSVRVSADAAKEYEGLRTALAPHLVDAPTSVLALDRMSGVVLLLGARPVGEPWTGPAARARSAAGLLDECTSGRLPHPPILLFNRPPDEGDAAALAACGLDLETDYRLVDTPIAPPGVTAYVPTS